MLYLAAPTNDAAPIRWPYMGLIGTGIALGSAVGIFGLVDGSFLKPIHLDIFGFDLNTSLIFDIAVYFAVLGLILGAFNMLGSKRGLEAATEAPPETAAGPPPGIQNNSTKRTQQREAVK